MKISAFTIVRNAQIMDYPIVESILSALAIVDEYIVAIGQSEDKTKELIESIGSDKIRIVDTFWDPKVNQGGQILRDKTNEALSHCGNDWCLYLQSDELIHEDDHEKIRNSIKVAIEHPEVEGLLFDYNHFYGSYDVVARARNWYRKEIRIVRKSSGVQSHGDAQGFRVNDRKLKVIPANANIFHYGWVKSTENIREKKKRLDRLWHGEKLDQENESFNLKRHYGLSKFTGTHPKPIKQRAQNNSFPFDRKMKVSDWNLSELNNLASDVFERVTGHRIGEYKNYELIKRTR